MFHSHCDFSANLTCYLFSELHQVKLPPQKKSKQNNNNKKNTVCDRPTIWNYTKLWIISRILWGKKSNAYPQIRINIITTCLMFWDPFCHQQSPDPLKAWTFLECVLWNYESHLFVQTFQITLRSSCHLSLRNHIKCDGWWIYNGQLLVDEHPCSQTWDGCNEWWNAEIKYPYNKTQRKNLKTVWHLCWYH